MAKLLITADDFGAHRSINSGIKTGVKSGIINSVSVIANGSASDFKLLKEFMDGGVFVGIHLTWVGEPFITDGRIYKNWQELFYKLYMGGWISKDHLISEAEMQMQMLLDNGIYPDHIDSHQHVHLLPVLWEISNRLKEKYKIARIRVPKAFDRSLTRAGIGGAGLQSIASYRFDKESNYYCAGIRWAGKNNFSKMIEELGKSKGHNTELIMHLGENNTQLNTKYAHWIYDWQSELEAILDPRFRETISDMGFLLEQRS